MMRRCGWLGAVFLFLAGGAQAAVTVSPSTLPNWTISIAYSQTLSASGCVLGCSWSSTGTLPPGLALDGSTGTIAGTPSATGSFSFTVTATDSLLSSGSQSYVVVINPPPGISTGSLPNGTVNQPYSQTVGVSGGTSPLSFSVSSGGLPAGLTLSSSGVVSGTPSAAGSFNFTITVTDSAGASAVQAYTLTINTNGSSLEITTSSPLPNGTVGTAYSQTLAATGGTQPYTWSVLSGALPPGISLGASSGALTGTPSSAGTFNFTVQVGDKNNLKASKPFAITVAGAAGTLTITTGSVLVNGLAGAAYSQALSASGGKQPYTWSITAGALPGGMQLNSASGLISGTPATAGAYAFTARVTDSASATADKQFVLTITTGTQSSSQMTVTGVPAASESAQQITFGVTLSSPYSADITGQATLNFQPDAVVPADDPAIQFSSGGRIVSFTIRAGSTHAVFPVTPMAFQTGTVAGSISLTFTAQSGSTEFSTSGMDRSVAIARAGTVLRSASVVKTASGFQVQLVGFSNPRELDEVRLHFTPATGQTLQTTDLKLDLTAPANTWYTSSGQFLLVLPFTVQGSQNSIASVTVQLQNDLSAAAATATF